VQRRVRRGCALNVTRLQIGGLTAFALSAGVWAGCGPNTGTALPSQNTGQAGVERQQLSLRVDGWDRTYTLCIPSGSNMAHPAALVVVLHGSGEDGQVPLDRNGWAAAAENRGFIVAAPDALPAQPDRPPVFLTNPRLWNSGQPRPDIAGAAADDVQFFDALLADVSNRVTVDQQRVYVAGHSGGGSMAFRLAAERAPRIAAIAVVAGFWWLDAPQPAVAVPTLYIVGTTDLLVPLEGGTQGVLWLRRATPPVLENLAQWASALGCGSTPTVVSDTANVRTLEYGGCAGGVLFRALFIAGQGHVWPGGTPYLPEWITGPATDELDATDTCCTFFFR
jgi:polyhydroxybutyrate depolymerase